MCLCQCCAPGVLRQQILASVIKWQILVPFQDPNLTLFTHTPDLSDCFQQTVLLWTPAATLWICSVFYIPYLLSLPPLYRWRDKSAINILKMVTKWFSGFYSFLLKLFQNLFNNDRRISSYAHSHQAKVGANFKKIKEQAKTIKE